MLQSVGTCIVIGLLLLLLLPTPTIWFSLDHKRNVSDGDQKWSWRKIETF